MLLYTEYVWAFEIAAVILLLAIVSAIALKRLMQEHDISGTVRVIPGVAEELVASRTYMVNDGRADSNIATVTVTEADAGVTFGQADDEAGLDTGNVERIWASKAASASLRL